MTSVSDAKLAANQANSQHSTGPKTEAGKRHASLNAFRHGLTGQIHIATPEEMEEERLPLAPPVRGRLPFDNLSFLWSGVYSARQTRIPPVSGPRWEAQRHSSPPAPRAARIRVPLLTEKTDVGRPSRSAI